jgi:hypothetical protein
MWGRPLCAKDLDDLLGGLCLFILLVRCAVVITNEGDCIKDPEQFGSLY